MTLPRYALAYHRCTAAELRLFIKQRTNEDVRSELRKTEYIKKLHQIDRYATFGF